MTTNTRTARTTVALAQMAACMARIARECPILYTTSQVKTVILICEVSQMVLYEFGITDKEEVFEIKEAVKKAILIPWIHGKSFF